MDPVRRRGVLILTALPITPGLRLTAVYMVLTGAAQLFKMLFLIILPVITEMIFMTAYVLAIKL